MNIDPRKLRQKLPNIPRAALVGAGIFVLLAAALVGAVAARAAGYENKMLPGVAILGVDVGGMPREEATAAAQKRADEILAQGFVFRADDLTATVSPTTISPSDPDLANELVRLDVRGMVDRGMSFGHRENLLLRWLETFSTYFPHQIAVTPQFAVNSEALLRVLRDEFGELEVPVKNATLEAAIVEDRVRYTAVDPRPGRALLYQAAIDALASQLSNGSLSPITIAIQSVEPEVTRAEAASLIPDAERFASSTTDGLAKSGREEWIVAGKDLASWIAVEKSDGTPRLSFKPEAVDAFLKPIAQTIETEPRDAKFRIQNGKVVEFQGSREGVRIDHEATRRLMEDSWIRGDRGPIEIVTARTAPNVATGDVNDLGIRDVLGVGRSNFSGSPRNRIKNIRNGANKLNGILIKPGDQFSLLNALKPFTTENGYLPELVIKGDKIIPELGGGLCQLGTTTFRMAMNAGMNITERQNHSLVVRYYNDPSNGNPGTDATIYDPSPDFRFINDTGYYLLITTEMNEATGDLAFTLWGTSDGRKGSYSKPVVLRWIPAPDPKETPTTDLPPGERKCDVPHPGADTTFTYTVEMPDGTKKETVYTSHYRALPQVCLVGVAAGELPPPEGAPVAPDSGAAADAAAPAQ